MSTLESISQPRSVSGNSEATAIEQSRAIAEVQAAVVVAQQKPRDVDAARRRMLQACSSLPLAQKAFYSVPNRGQGPSVHLARELAQCWGNIQHDMVELRRDDAAGESEMQAAAWDVEHNTRSSRSFISPHVRMKGRQRQALTDVNDIVNQNNNAASRAQREVIFTILPVWFVEEAKAACEATLQRGDGEPLDARIAKAIDAFGRDGISPEMLGGRIGRSRDRWDEQDVADLLVLFQSLRSGDLSRDEAFGEGAGGVTAAEIQTASTPPTSPDASANEHWNEVAS